MKVKIDDLKINDNHNKIYTNTDIKDLKQSIEELGLLEKIVVTANFTIISGYRRYLALKSLGITTVDVEVKEIDADDELLTIIHFNKQRIKTNRELLNEIKYLKSIWGKKKGRKASQDNIINLNPERTDTRKRIAAELNISAGNISKLECIDREAPELLYEIDCGDLSINQAYECVTHREKTIKNTQFEKNGKKMSNWLNSEKFNVKDEYYTPKVLVTPIMKYIPEGATIWCPFDTEKSEFVQLFRENNYKVIYSHIWAGQDFFNYEPTENYQFIVSNPPFSRKLEVLERLYSLDKSFAMLLGLPILNYQEVSNFFIEKKGDLQLLIVDKKVSFDGNTSSFNNSYFCRNMLPSRLTFCHIEHNNTGVNFQPSRMVADM
jgi:hypothetical protein